MIKKIIFIIAICAFGQSFNMTFLKKLVKPNVRSNMMKMGLQKAKIQRIVKEVANKFDWPENQSMEFNIEIIDNDDIHASLDPYRKTIGVTTGAMSIDIDELRFIVAHEIAHEKQRSESPLLFGVTLNSNYIRKMNEFDADKRAAIALQNPTSGIMLFNRMIRIREENKNRFSKVLDFMIPTQHPPLEERITALQKIQEEMQ